MSTRRDEGQIATFYSYKGGTGRSMALANVAWILASQGLRVLTVDWDLEAPGLHRYFHPFLEDKELANSPGLIDWAIDFSEAARHARRETKASASGSWHDRYTSLLRYTHSLDWPFGDGTLDFVPAGQQGAGYSIRVNGFDWQEFYDKLGGGVLLEGVKRRWRQDYDYVLIDSRTGISDTSGICTVQLPDHLVVCFTLNQQSITGAAAVAESADLQRRRATGEPSLKIWPVTTRVEVSERDRLELARDRARATFQRYLGHLPRKDREPYWNAVEILYLPFFAYEEVLAVFAEKRRQRSSMLPALEFLTGQLTRGAVSALAPMRESDRQRGFDAFLRAPSRSASGLNDGDVFVSFPYDDLDTIEPLVEQLRERLGDAVWWDRSGLTPGDDWQNVISGAMQRARVVLAFFGPNWAKRDAPRHFEQQIAALLRSPARVIPVLVGDLPLLRWGQAAERLKLEPITKRQAFSVTGDVKSDVEELTAAVSKAFATMPESTAAITEDSDDPQKGKWGGKSSVDGRTLTAQVSEVSEDWFAVTLSVIGTVGRPLKGTVDFHLHSTFPRPVVTAEAVDGQATLQVSAWGAFTVGVVADQGRTRLELDLSQDSRFPELFRSR